MHSLEIMADACNTAIAAEEACQEWEFPYVQAVDPHSALKLIAMVDGREESVSIEELEALGKMIRDLTGYIRLTTVSKPDPVREDLLLQATQLMGWPGCE